MLADTLEHARNSLLQQFAQYPDVLAPLVFQLRENAIAKSHRPTELVTEAGVVPAGHGRLDEMLVATDMAALDNLGRIILNRNTKAIRANLSAILRIEPWTRSRRNPQGVAALRSQGAALVKLFRYRSEVATVAGRERVLSMLEDMGIPFERLTQNRGQPLIRLTHINNLDDATLGKILDHPNIRFVSAEPTFTSPNHAASPSSPIPAPSLPAPGEAPTVGVFDTGVAPTASSLSPWVVSSDLYVLPPETDYVHGTAVGSLVAASHNLNQNHAWLPVKGCLIHNVAALEISGQSFGILITRLRQAISRQPDIKVWNLSLGGPASCDEQEFSEFAQELDQLTDEFGVLFVVAAGNYLDQPRRGWPAPTILSDRISAPGDSVRALTVGSMTHLDDAGALVPANSPAPYSRRGPGPVFTPKPDIVHLGGGVHSPWNIGSTSTTVLLPDNNIRGNFGTSFAAPIAANIAAQTWASLIGHPALSPNPSLIKALTVHSAQLSSPDYEALDRRYFGAGLPQDVITTLYDRDDSFTLVFEANLVAGAYRWRKAPYPIPSTLIQGGKFRGEVIITAAYAPPLDPDAGAEYVRANVEISFGILDGDRIKSKVPIEREPGSDTYEKAQIENGGKWSPIKLHRARFPNGITGDAWALQAQCSLRAFETGLATPLKVTIIVTLRSLDGDARVHSEGIRALVQRNWVTQSLPIRVPVST